jgi:Ca2+-binding RTX toxin-like protein
VPGLFLFDLFLKEYLIMVTATTATPPVAAKPALQSSEADASVFVQAMRGADLKAEILGGVWNDVLTGTSSHDTIDGSDGDDKLYGGPGNDTLMGGDYGIDSFYGGAGADKIIDSISLGLDDGMPTNETLPMADGGSSIHGTGQAARQDVDTLDLNISGVGGTALTLDRQQNGEAYNITAYGRVVATFKNIEELNLNGQQVDIKDGETVSIRGQFVELW